jgi:hypothetical protein
MSFHEWHDKSGLGNGQCEFSASRAVVSKGIDIMVDIDRPEGENKEPKENIDEDFQQPS